MERYLRISKLGTKQILSKIDNVLNDKIDHKGQMYKNSINLAPIIIICLIKCTYIENSYINMHKSLFLYQV